MDKRSAAGPRVAADLTALSEAMRARLGSSLSALLLIGGYARNEGGLVERDGQLVPYNDYDLVAVVDRERGAVKRALQKLSAEWSQRLGIGLDVYAIGRKRLIRPPRTLLWLDAALGGVRLLYGDATVLQGLAELTPRRIPLSECGRLLANRAAALAVSNLEEQPCRDLRLVRHGHKAVIACGDVRLLAADRYRGTLGESANELERLCAAPDVGERLVRAYRDAIAFRLRPDRWKPGNADLASWYDDTRSMVAGWHLRFEAWRVGTPRTPAAFAEFRGRLYSDSADLRRGLGWLAHLRAAARGACGLWPMVVHPRERLARVAVALAYGPQDPFCRRAAARMLGVANERSETLLKRLELLMKDAG